MNFKKPFFVASCAAALVAGFTFLGTDKSVASQINRSPPAKVVLSDVPERVYWGDSSCQKDCTGRHKG